MADHEAPLHQDHVEVCQALSLQIPPDALGKAMFTPEVVQELWDELKLFTGAAQLRRLPGDTSERGSELAVAFLQEQIRANTQVVRNWGYYSQVVRISRALFEVFDRHAVDVYGFSCSDAISFFEYLLREKERQNTERFNALQDVFAANSKDQMIHRYFEYIGQTRQEAEDFIASNVFSQADQKQLFSMFLAHGDIRLADLFEINIAQAADALGVGESRVQQLLRRFSLAPGSLQEHNPDHFFLDNPIWLKPVIEFGPGCFSCVVPQLFFSFVFPALGSLLLPIQPKQLALRRAEFLEAEIEKLIARRIPTDAIIRNLKWALGEKEYETDLIAIVDSHLVIVEAKSGRISPSALRGAPDRVRRHLEELLIAPNQQSRRLQERLYELIEDPTIDDPIRNMLPVELEKIHRVVRVSVTLDDFAAVQANVARLRDLGWLPDGFIPCPTMNIADFETLIDFLERPVYLLHYLEAREELESTYGYLGDELDLMGLYIGTLFNLGSLDPNAELIVSGMSHPIDVYYNSRDAGIELDKPRPQIGPLFCDILKLLEERARPRWTEFATLLLRISPDDQLLAEKKLRGLATRVRKRWQEDGHKNTLICAPSKRQWCAVCFVLVVDENADQRRVFMQNAANLAMEEQHVSRCLVIVRNIDTPGHAYVTIAVFERTV